MFNYAVCQLICKSHVYRIIFIYTMRFAYYLFVLLTTAYLYATMFVITERGLNMNKQELDILNILSKEPFENQRMLVELSGYSLGTVNKSLKLLMDKGYIEDNMTLTPKAHDEFEINAPQRAIILAAGYGMRMVPINTEVPKGLLEVNGEPLIERIIKQLHAVHIREIYVVVGFMKENYEYLIDEYGVELVVNDEYSKKNNLHSLKRVVNYIDNAYIIPCDIWCSFNPFRKQELYSWYMVSDLVDNDSTVRVNRKMELARVNANMSGNAMIGIAYLANEDAKTLKKRIKELTLEEKYNDSFWEEALYKNDKMIITANVVSCGDVIEINTYEQLRDLDNKSNQLKSDAISTISYALNTSEKSIEDISVLKKGMTNRSFLFKCNNKKYIMRIPGEGTEQLINRHQEATVYDAIKGRNICDDIVYINPDNGYKITEFLNGARVCNPENKEDLKKCMEKLRWFHELALKVEHEFDIFEQMDFYESLWIDRKSVYRDHQETTDKVKTMKNYIDSHCGRKVLTHIDAVPDNFMFIVGREGFEEIRLIDWEYAGMQDPHVDIAMFCIYSLYDRKQIDSLIDMYFIEGCPDEIRIKIYCYISACGLLWSNWCEYKRQLGVDFGEYSIRQYRYAKDYYRIAYEELEKRGESL